MHLKNNARTFIVFTAVTCLAFNSCKSKTSKNNEAVLFNTAPLANIIGSKPALFLSCIRCGCMVDELNYINHTSPKVLDRFDLFADTNCIKTLHFKSRVKHAPQSVLDSVYDENYSVMVFVKQGDTIAARLIKTEEVLKMKDILDTY